MTMLTHAATNTPADHTPDLPVDVDAWREWNARCEHAASKGRLVTDDTTRDDYPGTTSGWERIKRIDDRCRELRTRSPLHDRLDDPAPARSCLPTWLQRPLADLDDTDAVAHAADWVARWHAREPVEGLMLAGPVGTGKSTIAGAIASDVGEPNTATMTSARALIADQLEHRREHTSGMTPLARALDKPVLVVDDLGAERDWDAARDIVAEMLERRYDVQPKRTTRQGHAFALVVTTNVPLERLQERYGERVASRLSAMTLPVAVTGPDRRRAA